MTFWTRQGSAGGLLKTVTLIPKFHQFSHKLSRKFHHFSWTFDGRVFFFPRNNYVPVQQPLVGIKKKNLWSQYLNSIIISEHDKQTLRQLFNHHNQHKPNILSPPASFRETGSRVNIRLSLPCHQHLDSCQGGILLPAFDRPTNTQGNC